VVIGDGSTEGSETAKSGTNEQEFFLPPAGRSGIRRLFVEGKPAHHGNARNQQSADSRCRRNRMKENTLTGGALGLGSAFLYTKKSAEVIVVTGNEPCERRTISREDSQSNEGLNVKQQQISHGGIASRRKALQERK